MTDAIVSADDLLNAGVDEAVVPIPGVGAVRVRGLTSAEIHTANGKFEKYGTEGMDRELLVHGLVEPVMTEAQVAKWMRTAPAGHQVTVLDKIRDLSGLGADATKSGDAHVRGKAGRRVPVRPG